MIRLSKRKNSIVDLTGKTDLKQLAKFLKGCAYLVTNDTGTMHLAAALNTKIIGLFFAHAHPFETAPFSSGHLILQARISCAPCSYGVHCNNIICVEKVFPEHILSFIQNYEQNNIWKLPSDLKNSQELNVYETVVSSQGIVRLKPMIKHEININDIFRLAYSVLWRESLDVVLKTDLDNIQEWLKEYNYCDNRMILDTLIDKISFLKEIEGLGIEGIELCKNILKNISRNQPVYTNLGKFGENIDKIDEQIGLIGMANPELKLITDMFSKRKENQTGSDVAKLGMECMEYYTLLKKESRRMIEILSVHQDIILNLYDYKHNSIKVCVPGR
jgi:hypothetical protein